MNSCLKVWIVVLAIGAWCAQPIIGLTTMGPNSLGVNSSSVFVGKSTTAVGVGIGTPTPQYTLEVRGDVRASKASGIGNIYSTMNYVVGSVVDWTLGPYQMVTIGNGGLSVTFKDPAGPCGLLLLIKRTGSGVVAFPSVTWQNASAPDLSHSEAAGGTLTSPVYDILGLYYDGSNYYGEVNLDFH